MTSDTGRVLRTATAPEQAEDDAEIEAVAASRPNERFLRLGAYVATFVGCVLWSFVRGQDSNWDLLNYHLYNGLAVMNGRFGSDVAAAGIQTYLNPLLDVPLGVLVSLTSPRTGIILAAGALQYLCLIALWRLSATILPPMSGVVERLVFVGFLLLGAGATSLLFTTFGDWVVAALLCEGLNQLVRASRRDWPSARQRFVIAGSIIGAAVGLKLTTAAIGLTMILAVAALVALRRLASVALVGSGAFAGFLLVAGPWMVILVRRYDSPIFPFYNGIFRAASAPDVSFDDTRFGSSGLTDIINVPLELARGTSLYSELVFRDWRPLVLVCLVVASVLVPRYRRLWNQPINRYLAAVLAVSYALWIVQFGIYRYFLFGELVTSVLIFILVVEFVGDRTTATALLAVAAIFGLMFQIAPNWGREVPIESPELMQMTSELGGDSTVLLTGSPPLSYLVTSLPSSARLVNLFPFASGDLVDDGPIADEIDEAVDDALRAGALFAIADGGEGLEVPLLPGLELSACQEFPLSGRAMRFCQVTEADR